MINLINVEEPLRNALETIGWYCKHNNCNTCSLRINENTCITDKDPDVWWMYLNAYHNDEPQIDYKKWSTPPKVGLPTGEITTCVSVLASAFDDALERLSDYKDEPQTKCYLRTSCDHYGDKQVCGRCREYNLYSHTKEELQTVSLTSAHISGDIYHKVEDGPQMERSK